MHLFFGAPKATHIASCLIPKPLLSSIHMSQSSDENDGSIQTQTITRTDTPKMYRVILLNDDYTPMDFVVLVLKRFFGKTDEQAQQIMFDVHQKGAGTAGVYTLETAEMKVMQTNQFAQLNHHPLKCTLEEQT
jgi:ATP-dependent Clp protease adaptor protein ClpS